MRRLSSNFFDSGWYSKVHISYHFQAWCTALLNQRGFYAILAVPTLSAFSISQAELQQVFGSSHEFSISSEYSKSCPWKIFLLPDSNVELLNNKVQWSTTPEPAGNLCFFNSPIFLGPLSFVNIELEVVFFLFLGACYSLSFPRYLVFFLDPIVYIRKPMLYSPLPPTVTRFP